MKQDTCCLREFFAGKERVLSWMKFVPQAGNVQFGPGKFMETAPAFHYANGSHGDYRPTGGGARTTACSREPHSKQFFALQNQFNTRNMHH